MRVTLSRISKETGISIAAISQVLNNHPNSKFLKTETRDKILRTVREMGYHRNENAALTRTGVCKTVAFVSEFNPGFQYSCDGAIISGLLLAAGREGFNIKVFEFGNFENCCDEILRYGIVHVICFAHQYHNQQKVGEFCHRNRLKLCFLQGGHYENYPLVYSDDRSAVRNAMLYLHEKGHRRIGLINPQDDRSFSIERRRGYIDALRRLELPYDRRYLSRRRDPAEHQADIRAMLELPQAERPTAFVCADDFRAMRVENEALRLGIAIPGQCAVIGFGNTISEALPTPVSSIEQQFREIGILGFNVLIGTISEQEEQYKVGKGIFLIPTIFIERESTKTDFGGKP